jgi:hypothetical protein
VRFGKIKGRITDRKTSSTIQDASIKILYKKHKVFSDSLGYYTFNSIIADSYELLVSKSGYCPSDTLIIKVLPESTVEANFNLEPLPDSIRP